MRNVRWMIVLPVFLLAALGCGLLSNVQNGVQQIQSAATQLPGMLTAAPTMLGPMETAAAQYTPVASGQGLVLQNIKLVLQMTQMFAFTDGTVDGQPAVTAKLNDAGANKFPELKSTFSAEFIGDPASLSQIRITTPRTDAQSTVDEGIGLDNVILSSVMPAEAEPEFLSWLTANFGSVPVDGKLDKTIGNLQFTLERTSTTETLTVTPVK